MLLTTLSLEYNVTYDLMQMVANARAAKMASLFSTVLRSNGIVSEWPLVRHSIMGERMRVVAEWSRCILVHKGASINDVRKKFGFFSPPPPLVHKFARPPLLRLLTMSSFEGTPSPPQCGRHKWKPLTPFIPRRRSLHTCSLLQHLTEWMNM